MGPEPRGRGWSSGHSGRDTGEKLFDPCYGCACFRAPEFNRAAKIRETLTEVAAALVQEAAVVERQGVLRVQANRLVVVGLNRTRFRETTRLADVLLLLTALLASFGFDTQSLSAQGGQRRPHIFNRDRDNPGRAWRAGLPEPARR